MLAAALGGWLIDNAMFLLGRHAGQRDFVQKQLARGPVPVLRTRIGRHPVAAILGFRFVYGMKTVGAILIGMTPVAWVRFAVLDMVGTLLWALTMCGLGFGVGSSIRSVFGHVQLHLHLGLAAAIFLIGLLAMVSGLRWWKKHGSRPE